MAARAFPSAGRVAAVAVLAAGGIALAGVADAGLVPSSAPSAGRAGAVAAEAVGGFLGRVSTGADVAPAHVASDAVAVAPAETPVTGRALDVLAGLPVKGRAPLTGYQRSLFLPGGWADEDHDGCSTREEILQRDLTGKTFRRSGRCQVVAGGMLADPYTGRGITFVRGASTSPLVQIDHVVPLADAWQKGARPWSASRRTAFANDPLNLLATGGSTNQAKGASDAATWLPPATSFRCAYVARQIAVKAAYGLWVTAAERAAMQRILATCPAQPVPTA